MFNPKLKFLDLAEGLHPRVADEVSFINYFYFLSFQDLDFLCLNLIYSTEFQLTLLNFDVLFLILIYCTYYYGIVFERSDLIGLFNFSCGQSF